MKRNAVVKVYSTPTCPHCRKARRFLEENGIGFEEYNVLEDQTARDEMVRISGQMGVPVIVINKEVIVGFNEGIIKNRLGI